MKYLIVIELCFMFARFTFGVDYTPTVVSYVPGEAKNGVNEWELKRLNVQPNPPTIFIPNGYSAAPTGFHWVQRSDGSVALVQNGTQVPKISNTKGALTVIPFVQSPVSDTIKGIPVQGAVVNSYGRVEMGQFPVRTLTPAPTVKRVGIIKDSDCADGIG